jgi:choline monooxygenase
MFISDTHLPQLLAPEAYSSVANYEVEWARLFETGWHVVGTTADLPRSGDYLTLQLGKVPLLVRNFGDEIQTFLNVCSHRFCEIASAKCGHQEKFSCQYHGWEYDADGNTRRIPDAPSFKPLEKGMLGLTRYRTALCGQLIFVSLAATGPDLREFLGESYATYESLFSAPYEQIHAWDVECEANWKLAVENGLESYHVECVHAGTFGQIPAAQDCLHEIHDDRTTFYTSANPPGGLFYYLEDVVARGAGQTPLHNYMNLRTYPSLTCSRTDSVTFVQSILPLSPTRCVCVYRLFMPRPPRGNWRVWLATKWWRPKLLAYWKAVFAEDQVILPKIQKGISASSRPSGGVISAREERIFHFQQYVLRGCQQSAHSLPSTPAATVAQ